MGMLTLKGISVLFSIMTLGAGGLIFYFTFTQFSDYDVLWQYIADKAPEYGKIVFGCLGGITIITGLIGVVSIIR